MARISWLFGANRARALIWMCWANSCLGAALVMRISNRRSAFGSIGFMRGKIESAFICSLSMTESSLPNASINLDQ